MVRSFLLLTFLAFSAASGENDAAARIAAIEARMGGRIGVAAFDTGNSKHLDYRAEERFPMCSTFKLLAAAAVLKRVDEQKENLDRFVSYGAKDILEHAPVTKEHLKDGGMTLGALCAAAIEQSDNTAANLLLDAIGGASRAYEFCTNAWGSDNETRSQRTRPE
jgi:beta-lactamase class A